MSDILVQRFSGTFTGTSTTITISPVPVGNTFARMTNTGHGADGDTNLTSIGSEMEVLVTDSTTVTLTKTLNSASGTYAFEVISYIGPVGGPNEFIVRRQAAGQTVGGTVTFAGVVDVNDVVPFITGTRAANNTGSHAFNAYIRVNNLTQTSMTTVARLNGARYSYAIVEFTGSAWNVFYATNNSTATTPFAMQTYNDFAGTQPITSVNWSNAMIVETQSRINTNDPDQDMYTYRPENPASTNPMILAEHDSTTSALLRCSLFVIENPNLTVYRGHETNVATGLNQFSVVNSPLDLTTSISWASAQSTQTTNSSNTNEFFRNFELDDAAINGTLNFTALARTDVVAWEVAQLQTAITDIFVDLDNAEILTTTFNNVIASRNAILDAATIATTLHDLDVVSIDTADLDAGTAITITTNDVIASRNATLDATSITTTLNDLDIDVDYSRFTSPFLRDLYDQSNINGGTSPNIGGIPVDDQISNFDTFTFNVELSQTILKSFPSPLSEDGFISIRLQLREVTATGPFIIRVLVHNRDFGEGFTAENVQSEHEFDIDGSSDVLELFTPMLAINAGATVDGPNDEFGRISILLLTRSGQDQTVSFKQGMGTPNHELDEDGLIVPFHYTYFDLTPEQEQSANAMSGVFVTNQNIDSVDLDAASITNTFNDVAIPLVDNEILSSIQTDIDMLTLVPVTVVQETLDTAMLSIDMSDLTPAVSNTQVLELGAVSVIPNGINVFASGIVSLDSLTVSIIPNDLDVEIVPTDNNILSTVVSNTDMLDIEPVSVSNVSLDPVIVALDMQPLDADLITTLAGFTINIDPVVIDTDESETIILDSMGLNINGLDFNLPFVDIVEIEPLEVSVDPIEITITLDEILSNEAIVIAANDLEIQISPTDNEDLSFESFTITTVELGIEQAIELDLASIRLGFFQIQVNADVTIEPYERQFEEVQPWTLQFCNEHRITLVFKP